MQKIVIKRDNDVDVQSQEGSFDVQSHEVYIPAEFSLKTEPEVGPVSICFYGYTLLYHNAQYE